MANPQRALIRAKLDAIKKLADEKPTYVDDVFDLVKDQMPDIDGSIKRKIDDFKDKRKAKQTQKKDIFGELIKTFEGFMGSNDTNSINPNQKPVVKNKLKYYAKESSNITLRESKQIVMDSVKKSFFSGGGICGSNSLMPANNVDISPKEIDFLSMLKVAPDSNTGQIMYETSEDTGFIKMNKELYNNFDSSSAYFFNNKDYKTIFTMQWNDSSQVYNISGLQGVTGATTVENFLTDYYSAIEYPDITNVVKQAMMMTVQGMDDAPQSFTVGMNNLNRICQKLFAICGKPQKNASPLNENAVDSTNNEEDDVETYFNFEDVEGIDIDDENARLRRVLRYADCGNFESPVNKNHLEDFVHFTKKPGKNIDSIIDNTLNKVASESHQQSGGSVGLDNLQVSITGLFILNLPKALIQAILSPKLFLPIVVLYKLFKGAVASAAEFLVRMAKLFFDVVKRIFWKFIQAFWKFVKKDLLDFIKKVAKTILLKKLKRWKAILLSLITLLLKLLTTKLDSCEAIFNAILSTINGAINARLKIPIPGILLAIADKLPGFSADKAYMSTIENMTRSGIVTGPLYDRENKWNKALKATIDGYSKTMDEDSFVKIGLKPSIIPAGVAGAVITPMVVGAGKLF
jgi:hypothetical protein